MTSSCPRTHGVRSGGLAATMVVLCRATAGMSRVDRCASRFVPRSLHRCCGSRPPKCLFLAAKRRSRTIWRWMASRRPSGWLTFACLLRCPRQCCRTPATRCLTPLHGCLSVPLSRTATGEQAASRVLGSNGSRKMLLLLLLLYGCYRRCLCQFVLDSVHNMSSWLFQKALAQGEGIHQRRNLIIVGCSNLAHLDKFEDEV